MNILPGCTTNGKHTRNGIKRTLGSRRAPTPILVASDTESEKASPAASPAPKTPKPKGIKRTLEGYRTEAAAESTTATEVSEPEAKPPSAEKSKGIKRTLGGRRAHSKDRDSSPPPPPPAREATDDNRAQEKAMEQEQAEEPEEPVDDDEAADRKRAALRRQFATAGAVKPKKRKF